MDEARAARENREGARRASLRALLPDYLLYGLLHLLLAPFLALKGLLRARKRDYKELLAARLWGSPFPANVAPSHSPRTLVISAGPGETRAAIQAAEQIAALPNTEVALLVCTAASDRLARSQERPFAVGAAPFNNPFSALLTLWRWRPALILFAEVNDNPHLLMLAALLNVKTAFFNVHTLQEVIHRQQERKSRWWRYRAADTFAVQGEVYRERLLSIGVAPERVLVTGPDLTAPALEPNTQAELIQKWSELLGIVPGQTPVFVAGSTYPDEERILLEVFARLRQELPDAVLVLAPRALRRPEGADSVLRERNLAFARRSEWTGGARREPIVLLDTFGELREVYCVATAAFVGGSLLPGIGGHTPMEALAWGVPMTIGPHHDQQAIVVDILRQADLITVCASAPELEDAWRHIAGYAELRTRLRDDSRRLLEQYTNVYARLYQTLMP